MNGNVAKEGWNIAPGSINWWTELIFHPLTSGLEIATPDFGYFGGPGYCGGHLFAKDIYGHYNCIDDPNITIDVALNSPVARNSSGQYSLSDTAYKAHDIAYYNAENNINEAQFILQADLALLQTLANVFANTDYHMDLWERQYDLLAADRQWCKYNLRRRRKRRLE
jgi:hypothetical protein